MSDPNSPQGPQFQGPSYQSTNPQPGYNQPPPPGWQPQGQPPPPLTHAQARAQAHGAKAQAKALRPWFKKKRFILPLALIALIAVIAIAGSGGDDAPIAGVPVAGKPTDATKQAAQDKASTSTDVPGIGDAVVAGDWEFTITKFKCGVSKVGDDYLNKKAQGQFCLLNIEATNKGDEQETLDSNTQKLKDADGKEYSSDSEASLYKDPDSSLFLTGVNPGNTAKGLIVFDVPKKTKPTQALLSGGLFGGEEAVIAVK